MRVNPRRQRSGVAGISRNQWPASGGIGGRNPAEWVAGISRNTQGHLDGG
jgi:hypothetical protein